MSVSSTASRSATLTSKATSKATSKTIDKLDGAVYALGLTYAGHIRETAEQPGQAVIFRKHCQPQIQPQIQPGIIHTPTSAELLAEMRRHNPALANTLNQHFQTAGNGIPALLDYEVEIGLYLLESCSLEQLQSDGPLPEFGYFLANDITARSVQIFGEACDDRLACWAAAKSFPGFLPIHAELIFPEPGSTENWPAIELILSVNGQQRQREMINDMVYSPRQMLISAAQESDNHTLNAGDMILTGTPSGIALKVSKLKRLIARFLPKAFIVKKGISQAIKNPAFLQPGDQVEMTAKLTSQPQLKSPQDISLALTIS